MLWNLPNSLTVLRIVLIPVFAAIFYMQPNHFANIYATAVFGLAAITDWLDGYYARKLNQTSAFGAFATFAAFAFVDPGFLPRFFIGLGAAGAETATGIVLVVSFFGPVFFAPGLFLDPFGRPRRPFPEVDFGLPDLSNIDAIFAVILTFLPRPV